jgi:hypothetical protein
MQSEVPVESLGTSMRGGGRVVGDSAERLYRGRITVPPAAPHLPNRRVTALPTTPQVSIPAGVAPANFEMLLLTAARRGVRHHGGAAGSGLLVCRGCICINSAIWSRSSTTSSWRLHATVCRPPPPTFPWWKLPPFNRAQCICMAFWYILSLEAKVAPKLDFWLPGCFGIFVFRFLKRIFYFLFIFKCFYSYWRFVNSLCLHKLFDPTSRSWRFFFFVGRTDKRVNTHIKDTLLSLNSR